MALFAHLIILLTFGKYVHTGQIGYCYDIGKKTECLGSGCEWITNDQYSAHCVDYALPSYENKLCSSNKLDLIIMVDSSCPMSVESCKQQQKDIADTISYIRGINTETVGVDQYLTATTRIGYVEFGESIQSLIDLDKQPENNHVTNPLQARSSIYDIIENSSICDEDTTQRTQGQTALQTAVEAVIALFDDSMDIQHNRKLLIFSNCGVDESEQSDICQQYELFLSQDIDIIMVNNKPNLDSMQNPQEYIMCLVKNRPENIFTANDNEEYSRHIQSIATKICEESSPAPTQLPTAKLCEERQGGAGNIDVMILADTDGQYQDLNGRPSIEQCRIQQDAIADTLTTIKSTEDGVSRYPNTRVGYIEFNKTGITVIKKLTDTPNKEGESVTETDLREYHALIEGRCETLVPGQTNQEQDTLLAMDSNKCDDAYPTQLLQALQYVRNRDISEFDTIEGRDRYIIIFNNCKLPDQQLDDICDEMEDYIRSGSTHSHRGDNAYNGFGINVMIINQGYDGFSQIPLADDYLLCLVEYDDERIFTSNNRNLTLFEKQGLQNVIKEGICNKSPTANPTVDPTVDPTSDPTTFNPTNTEIGTVSPTTATTSDPTTYKPSASPSTITPTSATPTTILPTTSYPTTTTPTTADPTTNSPTTTSKPTTFDPTTYKPTASPSTINPTSTAPTTILPTTSYPTTASPTIPISTDDTMICGDLISDFWKFKDVFIRLDLRNKSDLNQMTTISLCGLGTTFDTILELYDSGMNLIATDDNGCGDSLGRSELVINNLSANTYLIKIISKNGAVIEGIWELNVLCATTTITPSPVTTAPTATPTTVAPTTSLPTTSDPTTFSPSTLSPVTAAPITPSPVATTGQPKTVSPTLDPSTSTTPISRVCPDYSSTANPCNYRQEKCCSRMSDLCTWSNSSICQNEGGTTCCQQLDIQMTSDKPTPLPTDFPTDDPISDPTNVPSNDPTNDPTNIPTILVPITSMSWPTPDSNGVETRTTKKQENGGLDGNDDTIGTIKTTQTTQTSQTSDIVYNVSSGHEINIVNIADEVEQPMLIGLWIFLGIIACYCIFMAILLYIRKRKYEQDVNNAYSYNQPSVQYQQTTDAESSSSSSDTNSDNSDNEQIDEHAFV